MCCIARKQLHTDKHTSITHSCKHEEGKLLQNMRYLSWRFDAGLRIVFVIIYYKKIIIFIKIFKFFY
jgi:hypothetical protein